MSGQRAHSSAGNACCGFPFSLDRRTAIPAFSFCWKLRPRFGPPFQILDCWWNGKSYWIKNKQVFWMMELHVNSNSSFCSVENSILAIWAFVGSLRLFGLVIFGGECGILRTSVPILLDDILQDLLVLLPILLSHKSHCVCIIGMHSNDVEFNLKSLLEGLQADGVLIHLGRWQRIKC